MRRTALVVCAVAGVVIVGCPSNSNPPSLSVNPSGAVSVAGPMAFNATVSDDNGVAWSLSGPGSLSDTTGLHTVYAPPTPAESGQTATLTASTGSVSVVVKIQIEPAPLTAETISTLSAPVTVLYDSLQIPHINCQIDLDCYAVQGYLHARDRLFQMDFLRRVARGTLATLVGAGGLSQDVQLRTLFTMRDGTRLEVGLANALDTNTLARVTAYVSGINARLNELTSANMPGEYSQLPAPVTPADIIPWTVQDVTAVARLEQYQLSSTLDEETMYGEFAAVYGPGAPLADAGKMNTFIRAQNPVGARTYTLVAPGGTPPATGFTASSPTTSYAAPWGPALQSLYPRLASLREALSAQVGGIGSNNWVVDGAHSASGHAMVANDPHLYLPYPPNFYLSALTSARASDNLDLTGGSFPGTPGALVGRGKNVGWGVTVVGYDVTDLYLEQVVPGTCATAAVPAPAFCVLFNGALSPVLASPQTFQVRGFDGALHDATQYPSAASPLLPAASAVVFVVPQHGPIIQAPNASGQAVSMRWTGQEGWTQDLKAFLGLGTATSVATAMTALADYATGAQNFVLADDQGNIGYDPHALVPIRAFADPPWFPLPGNGTAEWGPAAATAGCAAVPDPTKPTYAAVVAAQRACFLPDNALPQGTNPSWGFYATANSDPIGVSDGNNPLANPPYFSFDWDEIGFRHERITELLSGFTASGGTVSEADMETIQTDHVSTLGRAFTTILSTSAFNSAAASNTNFASARAMLQAWGAATPAYDCPTGLLGTDPVHSAIDTDPTRSANSAACLLFHTFLRDLLNNVFADDLAVAGIALDSASGQATKGMLHMLEATVPTGDTTFCNNVNASGTVTATLTCTAQVVTALAEAYQSLSTANGAVSNWTWGRVHTVTMTSQFPTVTSGFVAGPFARPGGALTVDVGNPDLAPGTSFSFTASGNVRHVSVMDPGTPAVRMQLPGPEQDVPYGVLVGPDLLGMWVTNTYFDYANWAQVQSTAAVSQTFNQ